MTMIQYAICKFETRKQRVIYLLEKIPDDMKRWLLSCIRLKFIRTLKIFKQSMNTWICQAKSRKSKILELLEQKVLAKIVLQTNNTHGKVQAINNLYANKFLDLEKSYKDVFQLPTANLQSMLYTIKLSWELISKTKSTIPLSNTSRFAETML